MVSKKLFSAVLVTAMVLSVIGGSSLAFAQPQQTTTVTRTTVTQTASADTNLTTLVNLLQNATNFTGNQSAAQVLNGTGNFTVLAPTNAAFARLNASTLAELQANKTLLNRVLGYHVIPGVRLANNFSGNGTVTTVNGLSLPYSVNGTRVTFGSGNNTATVTTADINATNGVVHVIDGALIPPAGEQAREVRTATASPAGGFLGLPGFEAVYAAAGLLAVAYLVIRRRK